MTNRWKATLAIVISFLLGTIATVCLADDSCRSQGASTYSVTASPPSRVAVARQTRASIVFEILRTEPSM